MASDQDLEKRASDRAKLRAWLDSHAPGTVVPMTIYYCDMDRLGLTHSARQRLSELRKEGYFIKYNSKNRSFQLWGKGDANQPMLLTATGRER